jgi:hypothetical protein
MFVPNLDNICAGAQFLKGMNPNTRDEHVKEFHGAMGELGNQFGIDPQSTSETFFLLGLSTARAMVANSSVLLTKGIDPEKVL